MSFATLSVDFVAQLARFQSGLNQAGQIAAREVGKIKSAFGGLRSIAVGIGPQLAAAFSGGALVAFAKNVNDGLLTIKDLSEATGASIENISGLENVARAAGGSIEEAGNAVIKLNLALKDADRNKETQAALRAIGLDAERLKALDPAQALLEVAKALDQYADDGERARLVQQLFGRSVKEVGPLLRELAEAGQLNGTVTKEQVLQADRFNKELARLRSNVTDVAREIAGPLTTALNEFFARARKDGFWAALFKPNEAQVAITKANELSVAMTNVGNALKRADDLSKDARLPGTVRQSWADKAVTLRAQLEDLQRQALAATAALKETFGADANYSNEGRAYPKPSVVVPTPPTKAGKATNVKTGDYFVQPFPETLQNALDRLAKSDVQKIAALRLELIELIDIRDQGGGGSVDEQILAIEEAIALLDPIQVAAAKSRERLNAILAATPTGKLEAVREEIAFINEQFTAGNIASVEQWAEAVRGATAQLSSESTEALDKVGTFAEEASRKIQDALGDTVQATLSGNFKSIGDLWKSMLTRMVSEALAANLSKALFGSGITSGEGLFGNLLKSLLPGLSSAGGGSVAGRPRGGAATGTNYVVRDMLTILHKGEAVIPRAYNPWAGGVGGAGGAGPQVIVQGDASENTIRLINGALAQFEARMIMRGAA